MKKLMVFLFTFLCIVSVAGCTPSKSATSSDSIRETDSEEQVKSISEYFTEEDGRQYLILPISQAKVRIQGEYENHLDHIDMELLKTAEETINRQTSAYTDPPAFYLQEDSAGYLCLAAELIVDINPPKIVIGENGEIIDSGCNIDHKHLFFSERITK